MEIVFCVIIQLCIAITHDTSPPNQTAVRAFRKRIKDQKAFLFPCTCLADGFFLAKSAKSACHAAAQQTLPQQVRRVIMMNYTVRQPSVLLLFDIPEDHTHLIV